MRKSTKIFLLVGLVPATLGLVSYAVKCTTSSCGSVENSQALLILGILLIGAILIASICASAYNFIYDRLSARDSSAGVPSTGNTASYSGHGLNRSLLTLFILGVVAVALLFGYSAIQDNQSSKSMRDWETQKNTCAKNAQIREEDCMTQDGTLSKTCEVVIIYGESGTQSSYYVNNDLYQSCLNTPTR